MFIFAEEDLASSVNRRCRLEYHEDTCIKRNKLVYLPKTTGAILKNEILATAISLLREKGIKKLSQPEICKALKIRQSQLTYYFPHRSDLLQSIASQFSENVREKIASMSKKSTEEEIIQELIQIVTGPSSIRGFLGLLIEADQDQAEIREVFKTHMEEFEVILKKQLKEKFSSDQVKFLVIYLRGMGVGRLLSDKKISKNESKVLLKALQSIKSPKALKKE